MGGRLFREDRASSEEYDTRSVLSNFCRDFFLNFFSRLEIGVRRGLGLGPELERQTVDAEAAPGLRRTVVKHVAQVPPAARTVDLGARAPELVVDLES